MFKDDLVFNKLQVIIGYKTQPTNNPSITKKMSR